MNDSSPVKLQEFATAALLSAESLTNINVVQYRKLRLQAEIDFSSIYQTPRNGRGGVGILVEMPTTEATVVELLTERRRLITFLIVEEPNMNFEPTQGTQLSAEEVADLVEDELGDLGMPGIGQFFPDRKTTVPAEDVGPGLVGYRTTLVIDAQRTVRVRVPTPAIADDEGSVTFANQTGFEDADIYWTQDGSFPGPGNPAATKYDGNTIDATQFRVLWWAAFKSGYRMSDLGQTINPNVSED